ncbi:MAG TPA: globin domain-containing protein [Actinospica sp.]|nr:globin domain-containing protein [Actinospica sp.]
MTTPFDPRLIQESFALVEGETDKLASHFYALLFLEDPALRDLFPPMMDAHRDRLITALITLVHRAHDAEALEDYVRQLGRDHRRFGVRPEHYATVGHCLLSTLRRFAGPRWTGEMDGCWAAAFQKVAGIMVEAANEAALTCPPWWTARVVGHLRPNGSTALVTVQPDSPYPYKAGQYASIETLRWPRVWRPYSMATAPAADGLLSLHVRAVDAGWVSSALVHHTRVGDLVRLGPPVGSTVCDPRSQRDVLLVGGGTGLAPMLALAEELSRWNDHRRVHLYFGVRRIEDLYGLDRLAALVQRDPWLRVVPCVSEDHRFRGERGVLAEVLARQAVEHDNWTRHDVFLAGSGPMVAATAGQLLELGVDERRIRFDSFDEQTGTMLDVRRLALTRSA